MNATDAGRDDFRNRFWDAGRFFMFPEWWGPGRVALAGGNPDRVKNRSRRASARRSRMRTKKTRGWA